MALLFDIDARSKDAYRQTEDVRRTYLLTCSRDSIKISILNHDGRLLKDLDCLVKVDCFILG